MALTFLLKAQKIMNGLVLKSNQYIKSCFILFEFVDLNCIFFVSTREIFQIVCSKFFLQLLKKSSQFCTKMDGYFGFFSSFYPILPILRKLSICHCYISWYWLVFRFSTGSCNVQFYHPTCLKNTFYFTFLVQFSFFKKCFISLLLCNFFSLKKFYFLSIFSCKCSFLLHAFFAMVQSSLMLVELIDDVGFQSPNCSLALIEDCTYLYKAQSEKSPNHLERSPNV